MKKHISKFTNSKITLGSIIFGGLLLIIFDIVFAYYSNIGINISSNITTIPSIIYTIILILITIFAISINISLLKFVNRKYFTSFFQSNIIVPLNQSMSSVRSSVRSSDRSSVRSSAKSTKSTKTNNTTTFENPTPINIISKPVKIIQSNITTTNKLNFNIIKTSIFVIISCLFNIITIIGSYGIAISYDDKGVWEYFLVYISIFLSSQFSPIFLLFVL